MAEQLGVHHEALRSWSRQAEAESGTTPAASPLVSLVITLALMPRQLRQRQQSRTLTRNLSASIYIYGRLCFILHGHHRIPREERRE
ncbi:transposase [Micromonospora echinospora]|uniref:transposase n=1 Tax=Micromonospora echinospora TaxID=1877 RepID=UPI00366FDC85